MHCTGSNRAAENLPWSSGFGRSSSRRGGTDESFSRRRNGMPASRQAQLSPGHVKGSTQNQKPSTETMNDAQITVSYMLVTGGRPAMRNPQRKAPSRIADRRQRDQQPAA